jgi:protein ImuB
MLITWRRVRHRITRSEGPERIAPAWWEHIAPHPASSSVLPSTRDYYLIETVAGARYWVFRAGLYAREADDDGAEEDEAPNRAPRWFMHGLMS